MKSEIRVVPHSEIPGQNVAEVFFDGKLVCAVYGADGPGVRVVSKHIRDVSMPKMSAQTGTIGPGVIEVKFDPEILK